MTVSGAGATTALPSSLTLRDATSVLDGLRESFAAQGGDVWRIDASSVVQVDTSALAVLLECARIAAAGKRTLEIVAPPARLSDLAHLYGVDGLLGLPGPTASAVTLVDVPTTKVDPIVN